jgi:hypothetical protein
MAGYCPFFINIGSIGNPLGTIDWFVAYSVANFTGVLVSFFEDLLSVFIVIVMREQIKKLLDVSQILKSPGSIGGSVGDGSTETGSPNGSPDRLVRDTTRTENRALAQNSNDYRSNLKNLAKIVKDSIQFVKYD